MFFLAASLVGWIGGGFVQALQKAGSQEHKIINAESPAKCVRPTQVPIIYYNNVNGPMLPQGVTFGDGRWALALSTAWDCSSLHVWLIGELCATCMSAIHPVTAHLPVYRWEAYSCTGRRLLSLAAYRCNYCQRRPVSARDRTRKHGTSAWVSRNIFLIFDDPLFTNMRHCDKHVNKRLA